MEHRRTAEHISNEIVLSYVREIRDKQPRIGTRKIYAMLKELLKTNDIKIGRDKLFKLLADHGLLVAKRKKYTKTTDSGHIFKKYPNLINEYVPSGPEQIWVSDITYLSTDSGFVYLSLVTDQYSKQIMGYHVHESLETNGPLKALRMALKNRIYPESKLIHHSDRGIQYCCYEYTEMLRSNNIQISMSSKGNPYENAVAERVNGILKSEYYLDRTFTDIIQVKKIASETIAIYNTLRPHSSCDYLTPVEAHQQNGILKKRWKDYKSKEKKSDLVPINEVVKEFIAQLLKKSELANI
jgi:putative transposase